MTFRAEQRKINLKQDKKEWKMKIKYEWKVTDYFSKQSVNGGGEGFNFS